MLETAEKVVMVVKLIVTIELEVVEAAGDVAGVVEGLTVVSVDLVFVFKSVVLIATTVCGVVLMIELVCVVETV